jgi:predicted nicotinamide N-methyase
MGSHGSTFILETTRLQRPPLLPELQLHLADEVIPVWKRVEEAQARADLPPYWAFAWAGGQAVARYVLDHPSEVAGKRVVDFATGSGMCAIAALKAGAASVLASDIDPYSADAVLLNAQANGVDVAFTDRDLLDSPPPHVDVILAGDICYEQPTANRVLRWLKEAHAAGIRVLIGDPGRIYFRRDGLIELARYDVPATRAVEDRDVKEAGVFTFQFPCTSGAPAPD